jgi:hypothetical protein
VIKENEDENTARHKMRLKKTILDRQFDRTPTECTLGSTVLGSLMGTTVTDSATYLTVLDICFHGTVYHPVIGL